MADETIERPVDMTDQTDTADMEKLQVPMDRFLSHLGIGNVFGSPEIKGDVTVVPVAEVVAGLGFGYGSGSAPVPTQGGKSDAYAGRNLDDDSASEAGTEDDYESGSRVVVEQPETDGSGGVTPQGSGGGGGGFGRARPVGFIRLDEDGAKFVAITDESRIALAGLVLAGWSVVWISVAIGVIARSIAGRRSA